MDRRGPTGEGRLRPLRVKICGITRPGDAQAAAGLGADALGFNLWPGSRRQVAPEAAREMIAGLPPFVTAVGLFVNQSPAEVVRLCVASGVAAVQLHGDEPPEALDELRALGLGLPVIVIKAFRVGGPGDLEPIARYGRAAGVLLDTRGPGFGGTGQRFDWELARRAGGDRPLLLAGGLTPENVAEAVRAVRPWAVDVASGVESSPGVKDHDKMARFIRAAKEA